MTKFIIKTILASSFLLLLSCQKEVLELKGDRTDTYEKSAKFSFGLPQGEKILTANEVSGRNGPAPRYGHSSVVFNDRMWILGGTDDGTPKNEILSSMDGSNWGIEVSNAQFSPRYHHATAVFQNKIWLIGGRSLDSDGNIVEMNDVWSSSNGVDWELETSHANFEKRYGHSLTVFQGALWLIGGLNPDQYKEICCGYKDIWRSVDGINWTQIDAHASFDRRVFHSTLVFDGKLWVTGGNHTGGNDEVWYSENGTNWNQVTPFPVYPKRGSHALVTDGELLWLTAGRKVIGSSLDNTIWYSSNGMDWHAAQTTETFPKRYWHTSLFYDNKLWVIQGRGHDPAHKNGFLTLSDIWSFTIPNNFSPVTDFNSK